MIRTFAILAILAAALPAYAEDLPIVPDPTLTPGVIASTDEAEVCGVVGGKTYSQRHRKTTSAMKAEVFKRYGIDRRTAGEVEVDHRVPLCLGAADAVEDLWIEPGINHGTVWTFHIKDKLEAFACRETCQRHAVSLQEAQSWFLAPDWRVAYCEKIGGSPCAP